MKTTTTVGVFKNKDEAENTISDLKKSGVSEDRISYIIAEGEDKEGDGVAAKAGKGAGTGAVIGGIAGTVAGGGIIPGIGALFIGGPLAAAVGLTGAAAAAVSGAATGVAAGGLIGALVGFGVTEEDAKRYEQRIKRGDLVLAVDGHSASLKDIFETHDAEEVRVYEIES